MRPLLSILYVVFYQMIVIGSSLDSAERLQILNGIIRTQWCIQIAACDSQELLLYTSETACCVATISVVWGEFAAARHNIRSDSIASADDVT